MKFEVLVCLFVSLEKVSSVPVFQNGEYDIWKDDEASDKSFNAKLIETQSLFNSNDTTRRGKVLNFFPIPVEEECNSNDGRRTGICMNTYECRMQGGASFGQCALGFGVCCVFSATCDQDIFNNITYFVNPHFPDLTRGMTSCSLKIKKIDPDIAQLRLDFIHFNVGQPNRRTGICEEDSFFMSGGNSKELKMCGINSGQHVYFDVDTATDEAINIHMNLSKRAVSRLWEIRITQIPFAQRAPVGCLQYHTGNKGVIQTMNFAENGRYLANQDYNICMRQESGMCSIIYEPCDENSFKIGASAMKQQETNSNNIFPNNSTQFMSSTTLAPGDLNELQDVGSGDGDGETVVNEVQSRQQMEICTDKILMPCDPEDFIMPGMEDACSLAHCGGSLCANGESPCKVESTITPFVIGVRFGASGRADNPEDKIGMCLTYEQQPCLV